ncbi:cullin, a subunit of E3 ubiquitin ligase [Mycolicibacterium fortuitum]|uniref:Cullin, a subunit of E3 ubiquitin ligase n=1 Tax=Mycolicibacterium fortuitum TaxID=1766 RepID=A0A378WE57_MYCFO|nr:cullin, a subunit of E3 ubiquitin ligase [Mycolicibacterium fortuitum]
MAEPFIGSEALAAGKLTRHQLRDRFVAVHKDVYVPRGSRPTAVLRAKAAWLRSRRRGVLAGYSAAALHGARWIEPALPANILDTNRRPVRGVVAWADMVDDDEMCQIGDIRLTTPARTAVDLACRLPEDTAVAAVDALARATRLKVADIESAALRRAGSKGIKQARRSIALVDPGSESPQETWLRLLVVRAGYPPPQTQHPIYNEYGALIGEVDMAWPELKIAMEYEGRHHTDPDVLRRDVARFDAMIEMGWIVIRVTCRDGEANVLGRLAKAWASRS